VKTALTPNIEANDEQPVISLSRVIVNVSVSDSFGGWGPKVAGSSSLIKTWN
jgi:hypothetical protein